MKKQKNIFIYSGILMLLTEIWKQWCLTYQIGAGQYNWWYFPFQLCSIPMYVCLIISFTSSEKIHRVLLTFLMDYGLLAGIFTFFDTSGMHYTYAPLTVHSYTWHILLILLGVYAGYVNMAQASKTDFRTASVIYLFCCLVAALCNYTLRRCGNINMFYISPYYKMDQKVFRHIAILLGNNAGIAVYILSVVLGAYLIHQLWTRILRVKMD